MGFAVLHIFAPEHQPHAGYLDTVSGPDQFSEKTSGGGLGTKSPENHRSTGGRVAPDDRQALLANSGREWIPDADKGEPVFNTGAAYDLASIPCQVSGSMVTSG